ncbi:hypothetical protein Spy49_0886c [Streptococcus pyogenes NZ131]|uniref:Uncharacterized protein n=1 Tax=Streptococcus pyogenes serotype M49 (strain NZ131) TaxID=471876 RepID=A0A0H3BYA1_STRPZ|nr:hypothetical protein Spy49_0886c [Streptococcus pyogenes NZ131]
MIQIEKACRKVRNYKSFSLCKVKNQASLKAYLLLDIKVSCRDAAPIHSINKYVIIEFIMIIYYFTMFLIFFNTYRDMIKASPALS